MSGAKLKKDFLIIGGILLIGASIIFTGMMISNSVTRNQLTRHAETQALHWKYYLELHPGELEEHFVNKFIEQEISDAPESMKLLSKIFRFEIFDLQGDVIFISGDINAITQPSPHPELVPNFLKSKQDITSPHVFLFQSSSKKRPGHYGATILPLNFKNEKIGYILAYVDQTAEYRSLKETFNLIAFATAVLMLLGVGIPLVLFITTKNEKRKTENQIHFLAHYDSLSQLPNRDTFNRRLSEALSRSRKSADQIAVICMDIDRFKELNETLGYEISDKLISCLAGRLKEVTKESDLIARLIGDEFAIARFGMKSTEEIDEFVRRTREKIAEPFNIDGHEISCTVSMGITIGTGNCNSPADLLKCADLALHRAKEDGRNAFRYYERQMDADLQRRRKTECELRQAIQEGQFEVFYQPQFDLQTNRICGNEALIRWHHPIHGTIAPGHFISIAEETGLISPIGEWVLREACKNAVSWKHPYKVAVNLSPVQFKSCRVADLVEDALSESGLEANRLELEITETILMTDTENVIGELNRIRELGVSIAMDDFGTGYSSLSYLSKFAFDKIKIDRSFTQNIDNDKTVTAIVNTMIKLGQSLDVIITAEGVETTAQAELLKKFGCDQVQGYLYGYPISTTEHAKLIDSQEDDGIRMPLQKKSAA